MAEEFSSLGFLQEILSVSLEIDALLDDRPLDILKALQLRQQMYDLMKRLECLPASETSDGLHHVAARAFSSLQARLSGSDPG